MVDPEQEIQDCLAILREGGWVYGRTSCGEGLIADATRAPASMPLVECTVPPVILLAEERDLYTVVAAPDPSVLNFLEGRSPHTAIIYEGLLGIDPVWLDPAGAAAVLIAPDIVLRHLVKRWQRPLAWLAVPLSTKELSAGYTLTTPGYPGHPANITIFRWENGQPLPVKSGFRLSLPPDGD